MNTFSQRNRTRKEFSGYQEATLGLRNRILNLYGMPYSSDEYNFGINNTNWIHESAFSKDLQMHFGRRIPIESFRDQSKTSYDEVFDFIELYYQRALKDLDYRKRTNLHRDIVAAFEKSGAVYTFDNGGMVVLKIDDNMAQNIQETETFLEQFKDAQGLFKKTIDGLISRNLDPKDVIKDMFIVMEDYIKKKTVENTYEKAMLKLAKVSSLHQIQVKLIEKLRAYRGEVWGAAHAGNSPKPNEEEALWYAESIMTQVRYIERKLNKQELS